MEQGIQGKNNNLSIVSFAESKPKLTSANKVILKLLKDASENKYIINRQDILDIYWACRFGSVFSFNQNERVWNHSQGKWEWIIKTYTKEEYFSSKYSFKSTALAWFKNNLGAVILKGRLIVLPVIEID